MKAAITTIPGADFSADPAGFIGPYVSVPGLTGLFDLTGSAKRAVVNHAYDGAPPAVYNRASPPTFAAGHVETDAVREWSFPDAPVNSGENTFFAVMEIHRAGGALPQSGMGLSVSTTAASSGQPNQHGQLLLANGPNFLRVYSWVFPTEEITGSSIGGQRVCSYLMPTDGSLDNEFVFVMVVAKSGDGTNAGSIEIFIPGVNGATPVATLSLAATDYIAFNPSTLHDQRWCMNAWASTPQKARCAGYAPLALTGAQGMTLADELRAYYAAKSLAFI